MMALVYYYLGNLPTIKKKLSKHIWYNRILPFKCHFCNLAFDSSVRRKRHEQAWHSTSNNLRNIDLDMHQKIYLVDDNFVADKITQ